MAHDKLLVTGSSGTVGTALIRSLLEAGYEVIPVDVRKNIWDDELNEQTIRADLTDEEAVEKLPTDANCLIHLAANARVHRSVKNPSLAYENTSMTMKVLEFARRHGMDFIFSSSREVYGNEQSVISGEKDTYVDICESPYTASKVSGEAFVKSYHECYDIETTIVRFSNVYGKYDDSDRVIPLFISQAKQDKDIHVYGKDKVLDFTYIDDCVDGILKVVDNFYKATGETFNIASGRGTSILELAEYISKITSSDSTIHISSNRTGEVSRFVADISKSEAILGYQPSYGVETGLEETVQWYDSHKDALPEP